MRNASRVSCHFVVPSDQALGTNYYNDLRSDLLTAMRFAQSHENDLVGVYPYLAARYTGVVIFSPECDASRSTRKLHRCNCASSSTDARGQGGP
jgi:hypothetical protein